MEEEDLRLVFADFATIPSSVTALEVGAAKDAKLLVFENEKAQADGTERIIFVANPIMIKAVVVADTSRRFQESRIILLLFGFGFSERRAIPFFRSYILCWKE